jgi:fatty acid CoA ligase FadD9
VLPGDRLCVRGFTSVDYTTIDVALIRIGAVSVALQTSALVSQLRPVVAEGEPRVIAARLDYLADAVGLVLTGHTPAWLIVFDYHREAVETARAPLVETGSQGRPGNAGPRGPSRAGAVGRAGDRCRPSRSLRRRRRAE